MLLRLNAHTVGNQSGRHKDSGLQGGISGLDGFVAFLGSVLVTGN